VIVNIEYKLKVFVEVVERHVTTLKTPIEAIPLLQQLISPKTLTSVTV